MIINPCKLDPRGPCREDAGTCSTPRSSDVTAQASAGWGHFARTGSPPPKPAFLPLRSTSCVAASAEPTASDTSVQLPCPGAGCSRLSRGLPVRFGFPLEVSAAPLWQGLKLKRDSVGNVTAVTHWEAKGVVASGLFSAPGILRWPNHPVHPLSCPMAREWASSWPQPHTAPHCPADLSTLSQLLVC